MTPSSPSKDAAPTFSWTATTDSGTGVASYEYGIASTVVYHDIGNVTLVTPPDNITPDGDHTLYIRAIDAAGNIGEPATLDFVIDTTAPTVTTPYAPDPSDDNTPSFADSY
jgi:hypothetical protein